MMCQTLPEATAPDNSHSRFCKKQTPEVRRGTFGESRALGGTAEVWPGRARAGTQGRSAGDAAQPPSHRRGHRSRRGRWLAHTAMGYIDGWHLAALHRLAPQTRTRPLACRASNRTLGGRRTHRGARCVSPARCTSGPPRRSAIVGGRAAFILAGLRRGRASKPRAFSGSSL